LRRLLVARLDGRAQPWACAAPIDLTVKRDSRDHQRLVVAAYELLRCIGARQPIGAHREPVAKTGLAVVRQWVRFGLDPASECEARTALVVARGPLQAAAARWTRICAGQEPRPIAMPLLARARRTLAHRRWALGHLNATHALVHLVRAPIYLRVRPFVEDVSLCAAAAEVADLLEDEAALRDLENLAWIRAAELALGPAAIEDEVRRTALQLLADADQVLTELAARAFEASAVLFIEWALGGDRRGRSAREGACLRSSGRRGSHPCRRTFRVRRRVGLVDGVVTLREDAWLNRR
ncbi:MAG: hypothetical protein KJ015_41165, partial [Myxococcales bacterium]|nr:hypothetical protein [Myxococcales bacterium]